MSKKNIYHYIASVLGAIVGTFILVSAFKGIDPQIGNAIYCLYPITIVMALYFIKWT